jgi:putative ABC transport system ATP-binding protein
VPEGVEIRIADVVKTYALDEGERIKAVAGVSLHLHVGSVTALIGPSGSGKSTLLHLIGGLDRPDAGSLEVDGQDLCALSRRELADYRRRVGFVFQRFNLLPALTALDNVIAPVIPYRTSYDKVLRARQLLDAVGIPAKERTVPSRMSGGEQQRVAIARALVNEPQLVLADEPTGNLDSHTGTEILDLLLRLRDERHLTILIGTHDPQIAARCDRLVRLQDGAITDDIAIEDTDAVLRHMTQPHP